MLTFAKVALAASAVTLWIAASHVGDTRAHGPTAHPAVPGTALPGDMRTATIHDPGLDMDAFTVTYPAKWHFQGTILQGTGCTNIPLPVYRMFSPDGLSEIERLPRLDWKWSVPGVKEAGAGCMPFTKVMTGKEILQYVSAILKVEYVRDLPVAPAKVAEYQRALANVPVIPGAPKTFPDEGDLASAVVRYRNGSFVIEGRLDAQVRCGHSQLRTGIPTGPAMWDIHNCLANVHYSHAPESKFSEVSAFADDIQEAPIQQWLRTSVAQHVAQTAQEGQIRLQNAARENAARSAAQQQQFEQGQALRQQQHEEFLSTMQRGAQMSMNQAAQVANSNHTIASDWVDYSLDRQTVRDPNTGQLSKVSSAYSYTWVDQSGKTAFQTMDVNANPNGSLQGTWTRQQVVHGDGSN